MEIFSPQGIRIFDVPVTEECEQVHELMKDCYVRLSWRNSLKVSLPVGSYMEFEGTRYTLLDEYSPTEVSETEYRYEVDFKHPMMVLGRMPFGLETNNSAGERVTSYEWNDTDKPANILAKMCLCLNRDFNLTDIGWGYQILTASDVMSATCTFSNMDYLSALTEICNKFSSDNNTVEYLIDWERKQIYLGCNIAVGQAVSLKVGDNIQTPSVSSQKDSYFNRFIVKGSSRNIWQRAVSGESVSTNTRLTLDKTKYPDGYIDMVRSGEPAMTKVLVYDDIFPKLDLYVYDVHERSKFVLNEEGKKVEDHRDEEGKPVYKTFSVWYIRLAYPVYDADGTTVKEWKDFHATKDVVIDGHTLMAAFVANEKGTHSALAGRDFKMRYHDKDLELKDGLADIDPAVPSKPSETETLKAGFYEILYNEEPEGIFIPTTSMQGLIPYGEKTPSLLGDKVVLYNIAMPQEYLGNAQKELEAQAMKDIAAFFSDRNNYSFKSNPVAFEQTSPNLYVGRSVIYEDINGYRLESRVIKLAKKLYAPFMQDITVGNAHIKGNTQTLKEDVKSANENINILSAVNNAVSAKADAYYRALKAIIENFALVVEEVKTKLSKVDPDTAQKLITFLEGIALGDGTHGIDGNGEAILKSIASAVFRSGFAGEGFRLWLDELGLANLEVDKLTVRQQMRIFELLIEKIRSIGGHLIVSAANGKVKEVIEEGSMYRLVLEGENMFMADDLIRCQRFTGNNLKSYWVKVSSADSTGILVAKSEFSSLPEAGDDIVLCGNTTNPARQSVISISAAEDGIPRIEVLDKISSKSFSGCLRVRIGSLDNIVDAYYNDMPAEQRPHGYGLYSDNAFLRGVFMLRNGDNIETRFSVVDGKVESMVSATEQGFLSDPWFVKDNGSWTVLPSVLPLTLGGKVIKAGGTNIVMKGGLSGIEMRGTRKVMHISGGSVSQRSDKFRVIPAFELSDGNAIPRAVRLSVMYRCSREGYLTASIHGAVGMGNSHPLYGTAHVDVSDELRQTDFDGLWNGTGDFRISFTGDMDVYGAILTTDMGGDLSNRYRTLFEQDEKILKLVSAIVDGDERLIREMGLVISAGDKSGLYYRDASGKTAFVGIVQDGKVILNGEEIELRGVTVINDKFKVDSNGYLTVTGGTVGGFDIGEDFIGSKSLFILDDKGNITLDENGNKVRDKYGKGMMLDADSIVFGTEFKDDGRSWIYGMHAETGCLAGEAGGVPVGQYLLQKLANVHVGLSTHYNVGTEYDIKGSSVGNLAFCGRGGGVLNGMIDGYGLIVQRYAVNGYVQISPLRDGNRALLIAAASDVRWLLPRQSEVKTLLREDIGYLSDGRTSYDNPFCFSLTLFGHPSAYGSKVYGRTSGQQPPYIFPRLFNVSRQPVEYFELLPMEAVQVWLVYNPFDSTEANRYMAFVK